MFKKEEVFLIHTVKEVSWITISSFNKQLSIILNLSSFSFKLNAYPLLSYKYPDFFDGVWIIREHV